MAYEGSTGQRCLATGRCHFDRENSKEHGELIFNVIMAIRHAKDGKMYLYDVMNIKKETSTLFQSEDITQ